MRKIRWITGALLLVMVLLVLPACGASEEEAAQEEPATEAAETTAGEFTNEGMTLTVPDIYADLVTVETPEGDKDGLLFKVSETASIEAAQAQGEDVDGPGWLFSIGRISEDQFHEMLMADMSGSQVFAVDGDGNYYMLYHPTDVRLVRANNEEMEAASDQWAALNEWAQKVPEEFIQANSGLEEVKYGNSGVDIAFAQIAFDKDVKYTLSTTEFGPLEPGDVDPKPYLDQLMQGVTYEYEDIKEGPDGEYVVLDFPDQDQRFDFFLAEGGENLIRSVSGDSEVYYKAAFDDKSLKASQIMQKWYHELAESQNLVSP